MMEPSEQELLDSLSERFGIVREYEDNVGNRHRTSQETQRAILQAMGVSVRTRDEMRRELMAFDAAVWRRVCDPALVVMGGGTSRTWTIRLPVENDEDASVRVTWEIRDEAGVLRRSGEEGPGLRPKEQAVIEGCRHVRFDVPVPGDLPMGYYDLKAFGRTPSRVKEGSLRLILAPPHCYVPERFLQGRRIWGLSLQLYALRSARNWGVGDFGDLAELLEWAGNELGAGMIGLSPLHALNNRWPYHISPYSPDSRLYLNGLYLDVERIPEFRESAAAQRMLEEAEFRARLEAVRTSERVDYDRVWAMKQEVLHALYVTFLDRHVAEWEEAFRPKTERGQAFARYREDGGQRLELFAVFQALAEELHRTHPPSWVWWEWPEGYRHPSSPEVEIFRTTHRRQILFHQYVQWVAEAQLGSVVDRAGVLGLPIGLYLDFALGSERSGSDAWMFQDQLALEAEAGAPPDAFTLAGQNWGLPPVIPHRLRAGGYRMFVELVRRTFRYGGALRIDHVMSLFRLFWIPRGLPASAGAYVAYPVEDLLGLLALESMRHRSVVIGEDLGTVPAAMRDRLALARVLSYRVLYFERSADGTGKPPAAFPAQALAVVNTSDLPTLAGYWTGRDIHVRAERGMLPAEQTPGRSLEQRERDKADLLRALGAEGLLPKELAEAAASGGPIPPDLCQAIHAFLARTPCWIVLAALDDVMGEEEQTNLPGTIHQYANWSQKHRLSLGELRTDPRLQRLAALMRTHRPSTRSSTPDGRGPR